MKKAKKFKTGHLDSLRAEIEGMFEHMEIAFYQMVRKIDRSGLQTTIGIAAKRARSVWDDSQFHIDHYDKPQLMANCVLMAEWLEELHQLSGVYYQQNEGSRSYGYMIGWHQLHTMLAFLASELEIPSEGGSKCWPPGSDC